MADWSLARPHHLHQGSTLEGWPGPQPGRPSPLPRMSCGVDSRSLIHRLAHKRFLASNSSSNSGHVPRTQTASTPPKFGAHPPPGDGSPVTGRFLFQVPLACHVALADSRPSARRSACTASAARW
jgi:hypothetical protein